MYFSKTTIVFYRIILLVNRCSCQNLLIFFTPLENTISNFILKFNIIQIVFFYDFFTAIEINTCSKSTCPRSKSKQNNNMFLTHQVDSGQLFEGLQSFFNNRVDTWKFKMSRKLHFKNVIYRTCICLLTFHSGKVRIFMYKIKYNHT